MTKMKEKIINRKKPNRLLLILAAVLICLFAGFFYLHSAFKARPVSGEKQITIEVIHGDGTSSGHSYVTQAEYLGELLTAEELAEGDEGPFGLFIHTVDGERADEQQQQWWRITKNGQEVTTGADQTVLRDQEKYELALQTGYGR